MSDASVALFAFSPGGDDGDGLVRDDVGYAGDDVVGAAVGEVGDGVKCRLLER